MKSEKILSSTDGQSLTPETQVRKVIYEDDTARLHGVLETDGRFFVHNEFADPGKLSNIKHYKEVQDILEENLASRGLTAYYTFADSPNHFKFCEMMGFKTNLEVWTIDGNQYEVMVKEL